MHLFVHVSGDNKNKSANEVLEAKSVTTQQHPEMADKDTTTLISVHSSDLVTKADVEQSSDSEKRYPQNGGDSNTTRIHRIQTSAIYY